MKVLGLIFASLCLIAIIFSCAAQFGLEDREERNPESRIDMEQVRFEYWLRHTSQTVRDMGSGDQWDMYEDNMRHANFAQVRFSVKGLLKDLNESPLKERGTK